MTPPHTLCATTPSSPTGSAGSWWDLAGSTPGCAFRGGTTTPFSALIGGESVYSICPRERFVWGGYYEPGTLIWRSRWTTESGVVECREALVAPADACRAVIVRRVEALEGEASLQVVLRPGSGFDRYGLSRLRKRDDGCWTAHLGEERLRWQGGGRAEPEQEAGEPKALRLEIALEAGESHDFVLSIERPHGEEELPTPDALWRKTEEWWREQVPPLAGTAAPRDARHAYAVMAAGDPGAHGGFDEKAHGHSAQWWVTRHRALLTTLVAGALGVSSLSRLGR